MIMHSSRFPTYNDGVLLVCFAEAKKTNFNAIENNKKKSDFKKMVKLNYSEVSKREQDVEFAESKGCALSLKVKTVLYDKVSKMNQVIIGELLYSIIHLDYDRAKSEMYFYLEEERELS